jgi:hypothetical protein
MTAAISALLGQMSFSHRLAVLAGAGLFGQAIDGAGERERNDQRRLIKVCLSAGCMRASVAVTRAPRCRSGDLHDCVSIGIERAGAAHAGGAAVADDVSELLEIQQTDWQILSTTRDPGASEVFTRDSPQTTLDGLLASNPSEQHGRVRGVQEVIAAISTSP